MIPFRLSLRPGVSVCEQVVYASKKAIVSGQVQPGEPFPSVRALSREFKIHPNTAHKAVGELIAEGLLEVLPGIGTVVADQKRGTAAERKRLLGPEVERLVVEAKNAGLNLEQVQAAVAEHWDALENRPAPEEPAKP